MMYETEYDTVQCKKIVNTKTVLRKPIT